MEEPVRKGVLLDLILINKDGPVSDLKVGTAWATVTSDHAIVEFSIMKG